jgi:serralysin
VQWLAGCARHDDLNVLFGRDGTDTLNGAGGGDVFVNSSTTDTFNGGAGVDWVLYTHSLVGVTVTLDGVANDGMPGEGDNVGADVENVVGSEESDVLEGNGADNRLHGLDGDDTLRGRGGHDTLFGDAGFDTLKGGLGFDSCDVGADGGTREDCES